MEFQQPDAGSFDVGTGPLAPDPDIMETGKVDLGVYYTQDRFEAEKEVFGKVWLNIAEASEIPNPGDWVVREVAVRSSSVSTSSTTATTSISTSSCSDTS